MLDWLRFILTAVLLVGGIGVLCISMFGVYRFKFVLNRMHAAAMGDTMGIFLALLGHSVSAPDFTTVIKFFLIVAFLWLASPVASHLIARLEVTLNDHLEDEMEVFKR